MLVLATKWDRVGGVPGGAEPLSAESAGRGGGRVPAAAEAARAAAGEGRSAVFPVTAVPDGLPDASVLAAPLLWAADRVDEAAAADPERAGEVLRRRRPGPGGKTADPIRAAAAATLRRRRRRRGLLTAAVCGLLAAAWLGYESYEAARREGLADAHWRDDVLVAEGPDVRLEAVEEHLNLFPESPHRPEATQKRNQLIEGSRRSDEARKWGGVAGIGDLVERGEAAAKYLDGNPQTHVEDAEAAIAAGREEAAVRQRAAADRWLDNARSLLGEVDGADAASDPKAIADAVRGHAGLKLDRLDADTADSLLRAKGRLEGRGRLLDAVTYARSLAADGGTVPDALRELRAAGIDPGSPEHAALSAELPLWRKRFEEAFGERLREAEDVAAEVRPMLDAARELSSGGDFTLTDAVGWDALKAAYNERLDRGAYDRLKRGPTRAAAEAYLGLPLVDAQPRMASAVRNWADWQRASQEAREFTPELVQFTAGDFDDGDFFLTVEVDNDPVLTTGEFDGEYRRPVRTFPVTRADVMTLLPSEQVAVLVRLVEGDVVYDDVFVSPAVTKSAATFAAAPHTFTLSDNAGSVVVQFADSLTEPELGAWR